MLHASPLFRIGQNCFLIPLISCELEEKKRKNIMAMQYTVVLERKIKNLKYAPPNDLSKMQ